MLHLNAINPLTYGPAKVSLPPKASQVWCHSHFLNIWCTKHSMFTHTAAPHLLPSSPMAYAYFSHFLLPRLTTVAPFLSFPTWLPFSRSSGGWLGQKAKLIHCEWWQMKTTHVSEWGGAMGCCLTQGCPLQARSDFWGQQNGQLRSHHTLLMRWKARTGGL